MKKSGRVHFLIVLLLLLLPSAKSMAQVDDCYAPAYQQGLALMNQGDYEKAIQYFRAALSCPTAPEGNDAQAKIERCQRLLASSSDPLSGFSVTGLLFAAADDKGTLVSSYGEVLHADEVHKLCVRMTYRAQRPISEGLVVNVKLYDPSGHLLGGRADYTYSTSVSVDPSASHVDLRPYDRGASGSFGPGAYRCEVWCGGCRLFSAPFEVLSRAVAVPAVPVADEPSASVVTPSAVRTGADGRKPYETAVSLSGGLAMGVITCAQVGVGVGLGVNVAPRLYVGPYVEVAGTQSLLRGGKPYGRAGAEGRYYFSPSRHSFYVDAQCGWAFGELASTTVEQSPWKSYDGHTQTNAVKTKGVSVGAGLGYRFGSAAVGLHGSFVPCRVRTEIDSYTFDNKASLSQLSLTFSVFF